MANSSVGVSSTTYYPYNYYRSHYLLLSYYFYYLLYYCYRNREVDGVGRAAHIHKRILTATVSERKHRDPVKWATLGESHIQVLRARVAYIPICNKHRQLYVVGVVVPAPQRKKKQHNKKQNVANTVCQSELTDRMSTVPSSLSPVCLPTY
jgi:hypothetical protein